MARLPSVPVVMYHSVGIPNEDWRWGFLTCPYTTFESHLQWMKKKGFHSISLQQLYEYMSKAASLPRNSVVLTFDDGYLDNWVFAYPLLKKYGFKGTIYVNLEFVDVRDIQRKNLEDAWRGGTKIHDLKSLGYLSWEEMKHMEKHGVIDIQSHTMTHTWYPISDRIIDFRHPGDSYIWMTWNNHPGRKPYLQVDANELVDLGEPVYQHERAIGAKRYFPDGNLRDYMLDYVKQKGGRDFFKSSGWREDLFRVTKRYRAGNRLNGRYETDEEYEARVYYELQESKQIIESKLDKTVKFLCWPGGAVTGKVLRIAQEIGYVSSTAGKDMKHTKKKLGNRYGEDPSRITRMGADLYWDGIAGFGSKVVHNKGFFFVISLYRSQQRKFISLFISIVRIGLIGLCTVIFKIPKSIGVRGRARK